MPIFKYFVLVGASLLGLLFVMEAVIGPNPRAPIAMSASLDVLRAMAHHGEPDRPAALAPAPPLPLPIASVDVIRDEPAASDSSTPLASLLNAQASVAAPSAKPAKPLKKKIAARKQSRSLYADNRMPAPFELFPVQSR